MRRLGIFRSQKSGLLFSKFKGINLPISAYVSAATKYQPAIGSKTIFVDQEPRFDGINLSNITPLYLKHLVSYVSFLFRCPYCLIFELRLTASRQLIASIIRQQLSDGMLPAASIFMDQYY